MSRAEDFCSCGWVKSHVKLSDESEGAEAGAVRWPERGVCERKGAATDVAESCSQENLKS